MAADTTEPQECTCLLCSTDDTDIELEGNDQLRAHIADPGWAVNCVIAGDQQWAYTVGLWHSFRMPELAIFGLDHESMGDCLNGLVERLRPPEGGELAHRLDEPVQDVFEKQPAMLKRIHPSWCRQLFDQMLGFYRTEPWLDVRQVVWPDTEGRWPWEEEVAESCRDGQPHAWMPIRSHPDTAWRLLASGAEQTWPFWPDPRDAGAFTTHDIVNGFAEIAGVVHARDGWQFVDSRPNLDSRICLVELGELVRIHSWLVEFADLPIGWGAWREGNGEWRRGELPEELQ